jgi:hypothetical protein
MIKGFLFYRIDVYAHRPAIYEAPQPSLNIHAGTAFAPLTVSDDTVMWAQEASDGVVFVQRSPVTRPGRGLHQRGYRICGIACEGDTQITA